MTKKLKIGDLTINLLEEGDNIRVKTNNNNVILSSQNIAIVEELIQNNFQIVSNHYKTIIDKADSVFTSEDINNLSMSITLRYLYMYNSWRRMYKKQENRSLAFDTKDFTHPSTSDLIFNYFRQKDPQHWEEKCAMLLGINLIELKEYYRQRESYYTR
jgi:CO dehydrogenase/acetyl-CoA synthase delta subunit